MRLGKLSASFKSTAQISFYMPFHVLSSVRITVLQVEENIVWLCVKNLYENMIKTVCVLLFHQLNSLCFKEEEKEKEKEKKDSPHPLQPPFHYWCTSPTTHNHTHAKYPNFKRGF